MMINTFLHIFGWTLCVHYDEDENTGEKKNYYVVPARIPYRGFKEESYDRMYKRISKYMKEHANELYGEANL